jgi:hypothetical protein
MYYFKEKYNFGDRFYVFDELPDRLGLIRYTKDYKRGPKDLKLLPRAFL